MNLKIKRLIATLMITIIIIIQINKRIDLDKLQLITAVVLVYSSTHALLNYIKIRKGNQNWWSIGYLLCFMSLLIFPILRIDNNEKDLVENRNLANKSHLFHGKKLNINYGKETESWLNDHFYKRKEVIGIYNRINKTIVKSRIENENALVGKDDWLFYKGDNSVSNFQNRELYTNTELEKISGNLKERHEWLEKQGVKYYTFVAPDKNKIYDEYYPNYIKKINRVGKAHQIRETTKGKKIEIIYPYEELVSQKKNNLLYWKTDTHWNMLGGFIGYSALMERISKDFKEVKTLKLEDFNIEYKPYGGDLIGMLALKVEDYNDVKYPFLQLKEKYNYHFTKSEPSGIRETKGNGKLKVLFLDDSYMDRMQPYMSQTFGEVMYIRGKNFNEIQDEIIKYKPDIVVHQLVERFIPSLEQNTPELKEVK